MLTLVGMALAVLGMVPFTLGDTQVSTVLLGVSLFVSGLGLGTVNLAAFTSTYRGLTPEQVPQATVANRLMQQVGGVLGTAMLAIVVQRAGIGHTPSEAFGRAFAWSLALTGLAVVPALLLGQRQNG